RSAVDAVAAIVNAPVGEQDLEERYTASIGCIAVANPHPVRRPDAAGLRAATVRPTARTGCIIFGRVGEYAEFLSNVHFRVRLLTEYIPKTHAPWPVWQRLQLRRGR